MQAKDDSSQGRPSPVRAYRKLLRQRMISPNQIRRGNCPVRRCRAARADQQFAANGSGLMPPKHTAAAAATNNARTPATASKQQAQEDLSAARKALAAGDVDLAEKLTQAANSLGVPESQFLPDEDRPSLVAWDIARAKQKESRPQPAKVIRPQVAKENVFCNQVLRVTRAASPAAAPASRYECATELRIMMCNRPKRLIAQSVSRTDLHAAPHASPSAYRVRKTMHNCRRSHQFRRNQRVACANSSGRKHQALRPSPRANEGPLMLAAKPAKPASERPIGSELEVAADRRSCRCHVRRARKSFPTRTSCRNKKLRLP